jgi:hypothetical protein
MDRQDQPDIDQHLQVLLTEYEAARDDERANGAAIVAFASVAVALLGGLVAVLVQDCRDDWVPGCWAVDGSVYALLPLPPLILLAYGLYLAMGNSVRSYYLRVLEREIHGLVDVRASSVRIPASTHLSAQMARPRGRGRVSKVLLHGTWIAIFVILLGVTAVALSRVDPDQRWMVGAMYAIGVVVMLRGTYVATFGAYAAWRHLYEGLDDGFKQPLIGRTEASGGLSIGHVLLPRPADVVKFLFLPAGALLGWAIGGADDGFPWSSLLLGFVGFELLLYQARYLLNDVRGAHDDAGHPPPVGRPDYTVERNAVLAVVNALVRCLLALLIAGAVWVVEGPTTATTLLVGYGAVVVTATVYEWLRKRTSYATTFSGAPSPEVWALYAWVGVGYGIRVALGAALVTGDLGGGTFALLGATGTAFGIMFVTMTWTLQSTKFRHPKPGRDPYPVNIRSKAHLVPLLRIAAEAALRDAGEPANVEDFDQVPPTVTASSTPLKRSVAFSHPWNLAAILALALAGALGTSLGSSAAAQQPLIGAGLGAAVGLVLVRRPAVGASLTGLAFVAALSSGWIDALAHAAIALPAASIALVYLLFRASSADRIEASPRELVRHLSGGLLGLLVGVTRRLQGPSPRNPHAP